MEGGTGTRSRAGLRRREFLIGGAGAGLVLAGPVNYAAIARGLRAPVAKHGKFAHGVAAGFPSPKGVTLWTRVSELDRSSKLTLEVAKDKHFNRLVKSKEVLAEQGRDFTVHEHVAGPEPGPRVLLPLPDQEQELTRGALPDAAAGGLEAEGPDRLLLLPGLGGRLLQRPGRARGGRRRPGRLPRRLHLRAPLLPRTLRSPRHPGRERRRRRAEPRRVPVEVPSVPDRRGPAGDARLARVPVRLGRPRGRGQLRRRPARFGGDGPEPREQQRVPAPGPVRGAAAQRLQGLLRGDAADPDEGGEEPDLRLGADRRPGGALPHRPAPVPRPAAVQRRAAGAVLDVRGPGPHASSAPSRRSGSRRRSSSRTRSGSCGARRRW